MSDFIKKRLARETAARKEAERILEEKSLELYFKNLELEKLNKELNKTLSVKVDELDVLENEHLELFESSAVGVVLTYQGEIMQVNHTFADFLGYEKEELVGKQVKDISYKDDIKPSIDNTRDLHNHKIERFVMQKRYKRKNGTFFWGSTNVSEVKNKTGETKYHLAVIVNIQKEKSAEKKLNQTVEQLKEINQNLENFAHIVSHDLKAPLTGINTVLSWMQRKELDDELEGFTSLMKERVEKMYALIEGIISYSKVSKSTEEKTLINVEDIIDETIQFLHVPLHITIEKEGKFPYIYINKAKFMQVFNNLLDNAIRHNDKEAGLIKISVSEDDEFYHFTVYDNGEGIEEKYFSKVFQIFNSLTQRANSTGIGLSLVKKIIEQAGGKISVQSQKSKFTAFHFNISKRICNYDNQ